MKRTIKTYFKTFVLLFGISFLLVNCEKDEVNNDIQPHQIAEINYKNLDELPEVAATLSEITASGRLSNGNTSSRTMNTDFGNLSISNILEYVNNDGKETYTFEIEKEVDPLNIFSFENLHLVKVGDSYLAYILKWEPNHEWYVTNNYIFEVQYFTGTQTHYDLDYNVIQIIEFNNGQIVNNLVGNTISNRSSQRYMEYVCVSTFGSLCTYFGSDNCGGSDCGFGVKTNCFWQEAGGSPTTGGGDNDNDTDGESESGGGGTRIPRDNDTSSDVVEDGGATVVVNPLSLEDVIERIVSRIESNIVSTSLDPCSSEILEELKILEQEDIAKVIQRFGSPTSSYNWEIKTGTPTNPTNVFETDWKRNTSGDQISNNYLTIVNNSFINEATNLAIARVILHEAIHAYILSYVDNITTPQVTLAMVNSFQNNFSEVWNFYVAVQNGVEIGNVEDAHHEQMALIFVETIRDALAEYDNNQQEIEYYEFLAWGGLFETDAWSQAIGPGGSMTTSEQEAIEIANHQENTNGTDAKGIPCQ